MAEPEPKAKGEGDSVIQSIKNLPPTAKWVGGGLLLGVLYVFYKRYKAAQSSSQPTVLPSNLVDPGFSQGGGSGGGGAGAGAGGGFVPSTPQPVNNAPSVSTPAILPTPAPPSTQSFATLVPNPIPGDTSTVVTGSMGGSPFTYGGSAAQAGSLLQQLNSPQPNVPLTLPKASGIGQVYTLPGGTTFTYG